MRAIRQWLLSFAASAVVVAASAAAFAAEEDQIVLATGKTESAPILEMTVEGVKYSIPPSGSAMHPWDKVTSVRLGNAQELNRAIDQVNANTKLDDASAVFTKLAADEKVRPVVRQEAMFHLGLARQRANDGDGAVKAYQDVLAKFPKGRYLRNAGENLLSILIAKRDIDGAAKALGSITAAAKAAGAADSVLGPLAILQGRILEAQGRFPDAQAAYEKVASSGQEKRTVLTAKLGAARCVFAAGKADEAERRFNEIKGDKDATPIVLAGAWNGLGDIYIEAGAKSRDADRVGDAIFAYMRGVVYYVTGSDEPTEEREHALAGASRAFRISAELATDATVKKLHSGRSGQLRAQLSSQFPGSRFIQLAGQ